MFCLLGPNGAGKTSNVNVLEGCRTRTVGRRLDLVLALVGDPDLILILPLTFISGIWFVTDGMPSWLQSIAKLSRVRAPADALQYAFDPRTQGTGLRGDDLVTLGIWLAVGIYLMLRFLRTPQGDLR